MRRRTVLFAVVAALAAVSACTGIAQAQTGGSYGGGGAPPDGTFYDLPFGSRDLTMGMNGTDVQTLNWVLRGFGLGTPYDGAFASGTDGAVRNFQASAGLGNTGVVNLYTRKALASRMRNEYASWYGPGFYGNMTACGKRLKKGAIGVAHKKLPCGTRVAFAYNGRWVRAKVIDRGPYVKGRKWDLTEGLATQLGTTGVGTARVKVAVAP
jgi:rare lipoprotein A (peptidoglycan hydrolase)